MRLEHPESEVRVGDTGMTVMATPESDLDFRFYYQGRVAQRVLGVTPKQLVQAVDQAYGGDIPDVGDVGDDPNADGDISGGASAAPTSAASSDAPEGSTEAGSNGDADSTAAAASPEESGGSRKKKGKSPAK